MSGAIIAETVIMATVEAPIASFIIIAMRNGTMTPRPEASRPVVASAIGSRLSIAPKEPPAPVMAIIAAESLTPCVTHLSVFSFSLFGMSVIARNTPSMSATTGFPMKLRNLKAKPSPSGRLGNETTEAIPMRIIGRNIGEKLWSTPGSFPYFSTSSSIVYCELAGISTLLEILLA